MSTLPTKIRNLRRITIATVAVFGIAAGVLGGVRPWVDSISPMTAAHAEDGSAKGAGGPTGEHGARGSKASGGDTSSRGQGQAGPSADSDAKGPKFGGAGSKPESGSQGGKKTWSSQELTDIGRMNVARAPAQVLDRSLLNAVAEIKRPDGTYNVAFWDAALAILKTSSNQIADLKALLANPGTIRVDSPLSNLAFYKAILTTGQIKDADGKVVWSVSDADRNLAASLFVAQASDKTKAVTTETVHAVDVILGFPGEVGSTATNNPDAAQDARVAVPAEVVRTAIYEVHEGL